MNPLKLLREEILSLIPDHIQVFKDFLNFCELYFATQYDLDRSCPIKVVFSFELNHLSDILPNKVAPRIMHHTRQSIGITLTTQLAHIIMTKLRGHISTLFELRVTVQNQMKRFPIFSSVKQIYKFLPNNIIFVLKQILVR